MRIIMEHGYCRHLTMFEKFILFYWTIKDLYDLFEEGRNERTHSNWLVLFRGNDPIAHLNPLSSFGKRWANLSMVELSQRTSVYPATSLTWCRRRISVDMEIHHAKFTQFWVDFLSGWAFSARISAIFELRREQWSVNVSTAPVSCQSDFIANQNINTNPFRGNRTVFVRFERPVQCSCWRTCPDTIWVWCVFSVHP